MPKKVLCPICGWESEGQQTCQVCGWFLFSEDLLLLSEAEVKAEKARLSKAKQDWQEAIARFQKGDMGADESAIPSLRSYLEQLGFLPGPAFETYARRHLPEPFRSTAFLGVEVQGLPPGQEAEITLNGNLIGTTKEGYLAIPNLRPGRYHLEASTITHFASREIEINKGAALHVELNLQVGKGRLRVLSFIGGITVAVGEQSSPAPCEFEVEAGAHTVILRRKGWLLLYPVLVRRGKVVELEIAGMEPPAPAWVGKWHTGLVNSVSFSPDGRWVVSGSIDKTMRLWEVGSGQCVWVGRHTDWVASVAFSPDGRWVVSGSHDKTVRLWEIGSRRCVWVGKGHTNPVLSVAFSPDGRWVVSGSSDDTVRLWEVGSRRCVWVGEGHTGLVNSVTFSPDGRWVVSGSYDDTVRLWEVGSGQCVWVGKEHTDAVESVAFSPDGRWVVSGSYDKTVRLWEVESGRCVWVGEGHTASVTSVAFSPDGRWVVSGSEDKTVRLWEVESVKCVWVGEEHTGSVKSVAFSPDGQWVALGSDDGTVRLWKAWTFNIAVRTYEVSGEESP